MSELVTVRLYKPHPKQLEFHSSRARYRVVSFGRQSGKSTACNNELLKRAFEKPGGVFWFISPTYDSATVMFRRAMAALINCQELYHPNKSELSLALDNGSMIFYKSGEVFENLRTETLNGVIIDEVRQQRPELWPMIIRPMLTTTGGWAAFASTPNGYDHFYDLAQHAQADTSGTWEFLSAPSTCNPLISKDELEDARKTMSEAQYAQEYLAEFRDLTSGKVYVNFGEENLNVVNPFAPPGEALSPYLPILVGMDFNLSPMAWTLAQKKVDDIHFFDEIWLQSSHTQEAARELVARVKNHKPGVILVGDATGKAGQRAAAGQSDYDIIGQMLDDAGVKWKNLTPESNPSVKDRINTVNARLKSASGQSHVTVNPITCPRLKRDFERVVWKQGATITLDQTTDRTLTHAADGAGYLICQMLPIEGVKQPMDLKMIVRWA